MNRSIDGLQETGEWHIMQKLLSDFLGKSFGFRLWIWFDTVNMS